ncbi:MAGE family-domain-containing protein [Rhodotorula diobovata]|uniref:MAGE family-domain-containing protein n=1 Tax=Rhodotorula diobovata TaxID=5288 RepID=A0A5C5G1E3_9BASI|nr:MAGE family-domain-containing protein [Rhodotorula diobovata]
MARPGKRRAHDSDHHASSGSATDYEDRRRASKPTQANRKSSSAKGKGASKPKGKRARRRGDDDSDDDHSDASDSDDDGGKGKKGELSDDEKKHYIQAFVRYVLFNESHRRVLKREDVVKNVLTDGRGRYFNSLLPKVQKVLRDVLGMDLHELRPRETASGKSQGRAWIVRSTIPQPLLRAAATQRFPSLAANAAIDGAGTGADAAAPGKKSLRADLAAWYADGEALPDEEGDDEVETAAAVMRDVKREEGALYGVLGTVLALILVNGKVLGDDQLISYLRRLSLTPSSVLPLSLQFPHPSSLTLAQFLNTLVKAQYLERGKSGTSGAPGTQGAAGAGGAGGAGGGGRRTQAPARTQRTDAQGEKAESGDPAVDWRWGPRAEAELGELGVARFVERVFVARSRRGGDDEGDEDGAGGGAGGGRKRGRTGERFMREVARAAGVKELAGTEGKKAAAGDRDDRD